MRQKIQEVINKFSGQPVFIIGGGNSLKNFDFGILKGKNVIAINSAFKNVDENAVLFWCDGSWVAKNEDALKVHPAALRFMPIHNADVGIAKNLHGPSNSVYLKRSGDYGFDPHYDNVKGNNSGVMAINFAINMGASSIILLGFDLGYVFGRSHYHNEYDSPVARNVYSELFIPSFDALEKHTRSLNIDIVNCSESSNLKCFKFGDIRKYL